MKSSATYEQLTESAKELLTQLAHINTPEVVTLKDRVANAIDSAQSTLKDTRDQALDQARALAASVDDYVRESPWIAIIGIATAASAAGFVAGVLYNKRSD